MSKQLHKNPKVELCFYNNPAELQNAKSLRITGEIEFVDDEGIKKTIYEKVKFLNDLAGKSIEPYLEVFRIKSGDAHFWTLMDILKEPELEHIRFWLSSIETDQKSFAFTPILTESWLFNMHRRSKIPLCDELR